MSSAFSTAAVTRSSLESKTRKIVPSATPAASAICLVVTVRPCSWSSGMVASTSASRRSSGVIGRARGHAAQRK